MPTTEKKDRDYAYDEKLIGWENLAPWMKDNEYILTGYRKASNSYIKSFKTIWRLHNETVNIWSHLLGAILFAYSLNNLVTHVWPIIHEATAADIGAASFYYVAVVNCFILSTFFHLFSNHSREIHRFGNELDHIGVVLVIYGTTVTNTYFEFYCRPHLRNLYWTLSTTFAVASAIFTLQPKFRQPTYRRARFYMYVALGLSNFLPVVHGLYLYDFETLSDRMSLPQFLGLGLLNFSGAAIYAARTPERWCPKVFDIWGSSHQIMHVLVVLGALSNEKGVLMALQWWNAERRWTCAMDVL